MALYKNLKRARVRTGKSQLEVAASIGISNAALSNYETGYREPDLETLKQLALYYGVSLDELAEVDSTISPIIDLWAAIKNKEVAFSGETYVLKPSQRQQFKKLLQTFFEKLGSTADEPKDGQ
ncbi:MAG: helix-turn-helix transcriptional regulator [Veillonella caviae]|nr:helix-turn-helix transcriptional regulator [Veillonella caviae]